MVKSIVKIVLVVVLAVGLVACEGLKSYGHTEFQEAVSDCNICVTNAEVKNVQK